MRTRTLVLIVGGSVLLLSGVAVALVAGTQLVASAVSSATNGPALIEGEAAEPVAVEPLECAEQCFTRNSIGRALSSQRSFRVLGVGDTIDRWGDYESTDAKTEYGYTATDWRRADLDPDACFFGYFGTPIATALGDKPTPGDLDVIDFGNTQSNEFETTTVWQSARVFETSEEAETHMRTLDDLSAHCTSFTSPDFPLTRVTQAPAVQVPDSVAAIGWVESTGPERYYVYDVQRGNIVVRSILSTWADEVSEQDFRVFIETLATDLHELDVEKPVVEEPAA